MSRRGDDYDDEGRRLLPVYLEKPKTRGDCYRMPRPCPWVSCRYHLYLDIDGKRNVKINHPGKELEDMVETCALDAAGKTGRTLEDVAALLSVTRERVRQIEQEAFVHLREELSELFCEDDDILSLLAKMKEDDE